MGFLNASAEDGYRFDYTAAANGTFEPPQPGTFDGAMTAIPRGLASAGVKTAHAISAGADALGITDSVTNAMNGGVTNALGGSVLAPQTPRSSPLDGYSSTPSPVAQQVKRNIEQFAKYDPRTMGSVAGFLHSTTEGLTLGAAGGAVAGPIGAAAMLGGVEGYSAYEDMRQHGVDPATAMKEGWLTGGFNAAMAFVPMRFAGSGYATSALSGAAVNAIGGAAQRYGAGAVLEANGYRDMAKQYQLADWNAAAADLVMGAAFGAYGRFHALKTGERPNDFTPLPSDVDRAGQILSQDHVERDLALGLPRDPLTAATHDEVAGKSLEDLLLHGQEPSVDPDKARLLADGAIADPRKDEVAPHVEDAFSEAHPGILDEIAEPVLRKEADVNAETRAKVAAHEQAQEAAAAEAPAPAAPAEGEEAAPKMGPMADEQLSQLEAKHGDMPIDLGDGRTVSLSQIRQLLADHGQQAQKDSLLHDVAAACFVRTLG